MSKPPPRGALTERFIRRLYPNEELTSNSICYHADGSIKARPWYTMRAVRFLPWRSWLHSPSGHPIGVCWCVKDRVR